MWEVSHSESCCGKTFVEIFFAAQHSNAALSCLTVEVLDHTQLDTRARSVGLL
jgi:hypothetical protein